MITFATLFLLLLTPLTATASAEVTPLNLTTSPYGLTALVLFILAYLLVIGEEFLHLRKSKPVLVAAGVIWMLVALAYNAHGDHTTAATLVRHNLLEYAELFLFLLAAMTYINAMEERNLFGALRAWLVSRSFSLRQIFWITGLLAFFISPLADNLTTALLMAAVVLAVGVGQPTFIALGCINIVIAANAGGAFSPFGDITTLMVWQKGVVEFNQFFALFLPSVVNWFVPALLMSFKIPNAQPEPIRQATPIKTGGFWIIALFLLTIGMAIGAHNFLHLPPVLGVMTGLGLLKLFGYYLKQQGETQLVTGPEAVRDTEEGSGTPYDVFTFMARAEWDTLMFFYGVILGIGGLAAFGYLGAVSAFLYGDLGATTANILIGLLSAVVDNIPIMFAVLTMLPQMDHFQWLLVTLTAGVGGSLLSIGSAAGVALMGQANGIYTFFSHLKWSWAILLGYIASIATHYWINSHYIGH